MIISGNIFFSRIHFCYVKLFYLYFSKVFRSCVSNLLRKLLEKEFVDRGYLVGISRVLNSFSKSRVMLFGYIGKIRYGEKFDVFRSLGRRR